MAISEGMLKIGALVAGLGIPAALIWLVRHSHRWRSQAFVVLRPWHDIGSAGVWIGLVVHW